MLNESTLVKIRNTCDGNIAEITTYSRKYGKHGRFMIYMPKLRDWVADGDNRGTFFDGDLGNNIQMMYVKDMICVTIDWLREDNCGNLSGVRQYFNLPAEDFLAACECEKTVGLLAKQRNTYRSYGVWFSSGANAIIAKMDKRTRRAFSKAIRKGAFEWPNTFTDVYADGGFDFFFRTSDGMCGGLIRHSGSRDSVYYGVHT